MAEILLGKVRKLKRMNPKCLVFFQNGHNCMVYEKDSFIVTYLFGYKIKEKYSGIKYYTFQITSSEKIFHKVKKEKINYMIVDVLDDDKIIKIVDFKEKNQYDNFYKYTFQYMERKKRIDNLYQDILKYTEIPEFDEEIKKIEKVVRCWQIRELESKKIS